MKIRRKYPFIRRPDWWRQGRWHADAAFALLVGAIVIIGVFIAGPNQPAHRAPDALAFALLAAGAGALAVRRQHPGLVLIGAVGLNLAYVTLGYPKGANFLPMIIAFFSAAIQGRRRLAWAVLAAEFLLFPWLPHVLGAEPAPTPAALVGLAGWLLVMAVVAELVYVRQQRRTRLREEAARQRAGEERLRIARELHDVLGHTLSLINVQASVAHHLIDQQPEHARVALAVIKDASKDALRELRSVLDVLRQDHEAAPRTPSPGLARLSDLVARTAEAGVQVEAVVAGDLTAVPASVDLAAFRIVQEALTNIMRHAGPTTSSVHVCCDEHELTLRIENEGGAENDRAGGGQGRGLLGMRERAAALGGVIEAGPRADGGFRVVARLPLDRRPSAAQGANR